MGEDLASLAWQALAASVGTIVGGVGAYVAIRVDIARTLERVQGLEVRLIERLSAAENMIQRLNNRLDHFTDRHIGGRQ